MVWRITDCAWRYNKISLYFLKSVALVLFSLFLVVKIQVNFATFPYFAEINECELVPVVCLNGATCMNSPGTYSCICAAGYTGQLCQNGKC